EGRLRMSLLIGGACIAALAVILAWAGPALIRTAAPVLMRVPRLAVVALLSLPLLTWAVVSALSLMAAWLLNGPDVLPMPIGDVCQRCLVAASPFDGAQIETLIPVVLFLLLPLLVSFGFLLRGGLHSRRRRRENAETARLLSQEATDTEVAGRTVKTVAGQRLLAFSCPAGTGESCCPRTCAQSSSPMSSLRCSNTKGRTSPRAITPSWPSSRPSWRRCGSSRSSPRSQPRFPSTSRSPP